MTDFIAERKSIAGRFFFQRFLLQRVLYSSPISRNITFMTIQIIAEDLNKHAWKLQRIKNPFLIERQLYPSERTHTFM